jgi:BirA family biotin operon repressor/biotin-[acetyl-CoA-carboxylase] ligase
LRSTKNSNLLAIGDSFIELESVDSTNNYAMAMATAGAARHGTLVFAHEQWAGKGQRGRSWTSNAGENIILSAVLEPVAFPLSSVFGLSVCVGLACHDFFSVLAGPEVTRIKWPNDLYWNDRKAGGILIENHVQGERWSYAIAGMGININQTSFSSMAKNPVSLRQITGGHFDAVALARELGSCLDRRYVQWEAGGASAQLDAYNAVLYKRGQEVRLRKDNAVFSTRVERVSPRGQLLTRDVLDRQFEFGEIVWVLDDPEGHRPKARH